MPEQSRESGTPEDSQTPQAPESPPQNPQAPPMAYPETDAGRVLGAIEKADSLRLVNQGHKTPPKTPPAGGTGGEPWRKEPLANFETNPDGSVKLNRDGSPKRKNGRPKRARPGMKLADGTTYGQAQAQGDQTRPTNHRLTFPGQGPAGNVHDRQGGPGPGGEPMGEPAGKVIADTALRTAKAFAPDAKLTTDEEAAIGDSWGKVAGGLRLPAIIVAVIVTGAVLGRVIIERAIEANKQGKHGAGDRPEKQKGSKADAHADRGDDRNGQNSLLPQSIRFDL